MDEQSLTYAMISAVDCTWVLTMDGDALQPLLHLPLGHSLTGSEESESQASRRQSPCLVTSRSD